MLYQSPESRMTTPHPDLSKYVKRTSLETNALLLPNGQMADFKNETEQIGGSFKTRGAFNLLLEHPEYHRIVCASAGSFAIGAAHSAHRLNRQATIFMPTTTPESKIARTGELGATIVLEGKTYPETERAMRAFAQETDFHIAHAFNQTEVIAGNYSLFQEIFADVDDQEHLTVAVPFGGGGLGAAACRAALARGNTDVVVGMFSSNRSLESSLSNGTPTPIETVDSSCEGSAVQEMGSLALQSFLELSDLGRLHPIAVPPAAVGAAIVREDYRRTSLVKDYGEAAYDHFPETTALVAEAALGIYTSQDPNVTGRFVAVRSGANADPAREEALLDIHRQSSQKKSSRTQVWNGPQTRYH